MAELECGVSLPHPPARSWVLGSTHPAPTLQSPGARPRSRPHRTPPTPHPPHPPTLRAGAGVGGVSGKVQSWGVASSRCGGIWPGAGSGERGPREVPWGVRARGAGPGGEGPGQARPLWWPGRGGGISGWAVFGPSSRAPWGEGDPGREGGGAAGAKGEVKEAKGQRPKAKKAYSTRYSQAVSHPSTNQARPCLASEIRRDRARSGWYGRRRRRLPLGASRACSTRPRPSGCRASPVHAPVCLSACLPACLPACRRPPPRAPGGWRRPRKRTLARRCGASPGVLRSRDSCRPLPAWPHARLRFHPARHGTAPHRTRSGYSLARGWKRAWGIRPAVPSGARPAGVSAPPPQPQGERSQPPGLPVPSAPPDANPPRRPQRPQ